MQCCAVAGAGGGGGGRVFDSIRVCSGRHLPIHHTECRCGADLSAAAAAPGVTYLLAPGVYYINNKISLNTNATTCYRGTGSRGNVVVRVFTDSVTLAVDVQGAAQLGVFNLVLDGQDMSAGIKVGRIDVSTTTRVVVDGVTMQWFHATGGLGGTVNGAALEFSNGARGTITNTDFLHNTCIGCQATLYAVMTDLLLSKVGVLVCSCCPTHKLSCVAHAG